MFKNKFWIALFVVGQAFSAPKGVPGSSLAAHGQGEESAEQGEFFQFADKDQSKSNPKIFFSGALIGYIFGYIMCACSLEREGSAYYTSIKADKDEVGVVNGLARALNGGMILRIETLVQPTKNEKRKITGNVGKVMEESVIVALGVLESNASKFGIDPKMFKSAVNVHWSPGAIPKDGPSAGIAVFCSLLSAFTGLKIKHDVAMTGELTLLGKILPVGCIKAKLTAAKRVGIKTVLMPSDNRKDVEKYKEAAEGLKIVFIDEVTDILPHIFREEDLELLARGQNRLSKGIAKNKLAESKSLEVVNEEPEEEYMEVK